MQVCAGPGGRGYESRDGRSVVATDKRGGLSNGGWLARRRRGEEWVALPVRQEHRGLRRCVARRNRVIGGGSWWRKSYTKGRESSTKASLRHAGSGVQGRLPGPARSAFAVCATAAACARYSPRSVSRRYGGHSPVAIRC